MYASVKACKRPDPINVRTYACTVFLMNEQFEAPALQYMKEET